MAANCRPTTCVEAWTETQPDDSSDSSRHEPVIRRRVRRGWPSRTRRSAVRACTVMPARSSDARTSSAETVYDTPLARVDVCLDACAESTSIRARAIARAAAGVEQAGQRDCRPCHGGKVNAPIKAAPGSGARSRRRPSHGAAAARDRGTVLPRAPRSMVRQADVRVGCGPRHVADVGAGRQVVQVRRARPQRRAHHAEFHVHQVLRCRRHRRRVRSTPWWRIRWGRRWPSPPRRAVWRRTARCSSQHRLATSTTPSPSRARRAWTRRRRARWWSGVCMREANLRKARVTGCHSMSSVALLAKP